jgi:hypothetical protein
MDIYLSTQVLVKYIWCRILATSCIAQVIIAITAKGIILMANWSRRSVLTLVAAGIGEIGALAASAAAGAHFAAPAATVTPAGKNGTTSTSTDVLQGPLAAFIPDSRANTIVLMRGEQVTTITDPALVQTLLSIASSLH